MFLAVVVAALAVPSSRPGTLEKPAPRGEGDAGINRRGEVGAWETGWTDGRGKVRQEKVGEGQHGADRVEREGGREGQTGRSKQGLERDGKLRAWCVVH